MTASARVRTAPGRRAVATAAVALGTLLAGCETSPTAGHGAGTAPPMMGAPRSTAAPGADGVAAVDLRGHRIAARVGEAFEVRLPGLPATGYRWSLVDPVPDAVRAVGVGRGDAGPGELGGAPRQEVWRFEGARSGTGILGFEFRRPGDPPTVPPAQRASFRVEVR